MTTPENEVVKPKIVLPPAPQRSALARYLRALGAIIWKDLVAEMRSRELLASMLVFALLVILIFNFALQLNLQVRENVTAGVLWVTFAFAGTLGLNRSMGVEKEQGRIEGLLMSPVDRSVIYFGKAFGNLIFMLMVEAVVIPVYALLYNTDKLFNMGLLGVVLLGSIGYVGVGTLLSSMAMQTRTRDILLPILLFPLAIPVILPAVRATGGFLEGLAAADLMSSLNLLIVYDIIFVTLSFLFFEYVVEE